jgi:uncharacterized membrane protein
MHKYLFLIIAVGIISAGFHGLGLTKILPWTVVYSDMLGFYERVSGPGFPYIDKLMEYPVLTGLFIQVMEIFGKTRPGYYFLSAVILIFLGTLATYFLSRTANKEQRKRLLTYWIFAPSMFIFFVFNWDIITLLFVILAFYCISKNKNYSASFFLALGFASKFYPIIYLAPLLLKQRSVKEWAKIIGIFLITFMALNAYFMFANFDGWSYFFTSNSARNSNPDSIWTLVRFAFGEIPIPKINTISFLLFGGSFTWLMWRYRRASITALCCIATILFLLFNKVFSPQYLLWLLPFFVLLPFNIKIKKWFYALEFSNLAAFFVILPWFFTKDMTYFYISAPFVLIRHIILVFILMKGLTLAKFHR